MTIQGSCHCGAVRLVVTRLPDTITECNCSICHRLGAQWAYFTRSQVEVTAEEGALTRYSWGEQTIDFFHCAHCGCTTHYESAEEGPDMRRAVNARCIDRAILEHIRIRHFDGAETWRYLD